jgi:hypothetical protein
MENKEKIRQDLINTEYVPPVTQNAPNVEAPSIDQVERLSTTENLVSTPEKKREDFSNRLDMLLSDKESNGSDSPLSSPSSSPNSIPSSVSGLSIKENMEPNLDDNNSDYSRGSNLSRKLKELLGDDSESGWTPDSRKSNVSPEKSNSRIDKYSRHRDKRGHSVAPADTVPAPTLAELEAKGGYVPRPTMRNLNQVNRSEQEDEDSKREILFKFDLLKKSYPASNIPEYTIHTDLSTMEKSYSDCVRRLSLDSSVESYKTYLVYGFMGVEFILGNFLGFDMQGFTQQQIISMHSYEKLLIELGEKSYVPSGTSWPVELRLIFMIIMNAAFFVISKMMMKKTGANLMGMINSMNRPSTQSGASARKRKMRGPTVDLGDIPMT